MWYKSPVEFIESLAFTRRLSHLLGETADAVLQEIQEDLQANPLRGPLVRGLGGIRKARHSDPARKKGKRGGLRYLYVYLERREHIHLLYLFAKNEEEDLTQQERAWLRELAEHLESAEVRQWQGRSK